MVGTINAPTAGNTVLKYAAAAAAVGESAASVQSTNAFKTGASLTTFSISKITDEISSTASSTDRSSEQTGSGDGDGTSTSAASAKGTATGMSGGLIAGIVLGTAAVLLGALGLWIFWQRANILQGQKSTRGSIRLLRPAKLEGDKRVQAKELEVTERPLELGSGMACGKQFVNYQGDNAWTNQTL
jgi:hypothetical protein